jgi:Xaa-Pro aminopeptidase
MRDSAPLDAALAEHDADGYLIDADATEADQYYLAGFGAPDPFLTCYTPEGIHLLVSELEYGRARSESSADTVARNADYDHREHVAEHGALEGRNRTIAAFLEEHGVEHVLVPDRFPTATADGLREQGIAVTADLEETVATIRARKTNQEVEHLKVAQRANEAAMDRAAELIGGAEIVADADAEGATDQDATLFHDGEPLTSEFVKTEIEIALLREGCALDETIVAGGADGADPHDRGSGPLPGHEPIVVDIFPRDKATKYHADMTRTFVRGEPSEEVVRRHEVTLQAQEAAFDAIEPGATGEEVHDAVCDVYEAEGYETLRSDQITETGYIHGTGHGLGLEVHELPRLAPDGAELEPGHVVTVEPGLYDPAVGGMRIEDVVVVTEDGFENYVDYPKELVVG